MSGTVGFGALTGAGCCHYVNLIALNYVVVTFTVLNPERLPPKDGPERTRTTSCNNVNATK